MTPKQKIQNIINAANSTMNSNFEDLTSAVVALRDGYGSSAAPTKGIVPTSYDDDGYVTACAFYGTSVPDGCFDFYKTSTVVFKNDVTSIGKSALKWCAMLQTANLPDSITTIGDSAFSGCIFYSPNSLPSSLERIGNSAFSGTMIGNVDTIYAKYSIGESAFQGCVALGPKLKIKTRDLGGGCFFSCPGIKAVWISAEVLSIVAPDKWSTPFSYCENLTDIYTNAFSKNPGWGNYWYYTGSNRYATIHYGVQESDFDAIELEPIDLTEWYQYLEERMNDMNSDYGGGRQR